MHQQTSTSATTFLSALLSLPSNTITQVERVDTTFFKPQHVRPAFHTSTLNREPRRWIKRPLSKALTTDAPNYRLPRQRLTRFSLSELLTLNFPEQAFLVDGLVPRGLVMLAGAPKVGKSWMVLDLAYRVASGEPFLEQAVEQGSVLYLALEDEARRLKERIHLVAPDIANKNVPLDFATEFPRQDEGGLTELEDWLRQAENPKLAIIDIWGRFEPLSGGPSRESYAQVTAQLQAVQALAHKYDITILLIHHTKKANGDMQGGDPFDQVIGSRALTSNMDATLMLTRTRYQGDATLGVTGRDFEERKLGLTFNKATYRWESNERPHVPALPAERQRVLDAITRGTTDTGELVRHLNRNRTGVSNDLAILVDEGFIRRVKNGKYALTTPETPSSTEEWHDMNDNVTYPDLDGLI